MMPDAAAATRLARLWELTLGHRSFADDDPYFEVGGDSRLVVELTLLVNEEFGTQLAVSDVFSHPTIAALADLIQPTAGPARPATEAADARPRSDGRQTSSARVADDAGPTPQAHPARTRTDIAIIGLACRVPGAADLDALWDLLMSGECPITGLPQDRADLFEQYYRLHPDAPRVGDVRGGFLPGIDLFDAPFFGVSFGDADTIDPAQRLFLEVAWNALEDAGYAGRPCQEPDTGIFVGATTGEYARLNPAGPALNGHELSLIPNRLSYFLDVHGPSVPVDTACSSSLVALDLACQSLAAGGCQMAIVGGVNLLLTPERFFTLGSKGVLSPSGRCSPFDEAADGLVPAEGAVALVAKRLDDAVADGDSILAVVRGTAVNHNGHTNGINSPNPAAQAAVIEKAWRRAGITPEVISYIEAHGTGTKLGDPLEIAGLVQAFNQFPKNSGHCRIGSIKSSIGHLEWAAGLVGIVKCILAMQNNTIPGNLNFTSLSSRIDFAGLALRIAGDTSSWEPGDQRRVFAVSSFGIGGVNAHAVLEEPPPRPTPASSGGPQLLALSARSENELRQRAAELRRQLTARLDWSAGDVCAALSKGRGGFDVRTAVVVNGRADLLRELDRIAEAAGAVTHA